MENPDVSCPSEAKVSVPVEGAQYISLYKSFKKMLSRDGSLVMFGSFDEMNLLDIEVPLVERADLAAAVRGDWLMAPALAMGATDYFGVRFEVVEPEGNSSEQVSFLFSAIRSYAERLHPQSRLLDSEWVFSAEDAPVSLILGLKSSCLGMALCHFFLVDQFFWYD